MSITITRENDAITKANIVQEVLADLPEWFGLPNSMTAYVDAARDLPLWVARNEKNVVGFIGLTTTSAATAEVQCMGIKRAYHHQGIGRRLMVELIANARQTFSYLQVKTVAPGHYTAYDQTNTFYRAVGFDPLEVFPTFWDTWNPCLILIQKL
ncbi:GNAT family N-acetyltransferase [Levilactobacillus fujinensis]|uniref:GNAT family N-acetyltransferase n=1 Tax=Levilactobacillus fujinensis TaxID=2486024 RepID=A0ABW1TJS6_9LACO|nr:GNAT family N-acetyltransferase [Levilactobacillus fujinensis]